MLLFNLWIFLESGDVYGFGLNERGQAGKYASFQADVPSKVPLPDKAYNIASTYFPIHPYPLLTLLSIK
mgnify:CR=1 FL=1